MTTTNHTSMLSRAFADVHAKWSWFVGLGLIFIVLGAVAAGNLLLATIVTVYYVSAGMIVAGVMQIVQSLRVKTWGGFLWWMLSGVLYTAAGVVTSMNPLLASVFLTLMLALLTVASGVARLWLGFQARTDHGWGWIVASGVVTAIAGLVFLLGWPVNSLWLLGLVLAIDLVFQGCALVGLGLRFRAA
ncbi:HdeD family acid-resistance protein [Bradyrhizobium sp. Pear77]|uniref:HdeD family acid-resistance protein n=1 Tax=Bradyrhizobium altum TaxID=1571202 RepID=UPI001E31434A|nr:HdeD family acid-resistance protein [Bradyrhizobium altum]MCC8952809.1 HdeD family acid-resistance protein [Bradyrhizobium altum]